MRIREGKRMLPAFCLLVVFQDVVLARLGELAAGGWVVDEALSD